MKRATTILFLIVSEFCLATESTPNPLVPVTQAQLSGKIRECKFIETGHTFFISEEKKCPERHPNMVLACYRRPVLERFMVGHPQLDHVYVPDSKLHC